MSGAGTVGFIGLGNMGRPIAVNVGKGGHEMIAYDAAGTAERAPEGARVAGSVAQVAAEADTVLLSLPDGKVVASVAEEIIETNNRRVACVADTSTVGIDAARAAQRRFADAEIEYVDAPVSGGTAGAAAASIAVMYAGSEATFERLMPVFTSMAKNVFYIGPNPGQGQAMKILNNYLSATAMAATSEAVAFGEAEGLDPNTVVAVLNASSGQNTASSDKFPNRILKGKFDAGFTNTLLCKDVGLYMDAVARAGTADTVGQTVIGVWRKFLAAEPGADICSVYPFIKGKRRS